MIKKIDIDIVEEKDKLLEILQKTTQSANLNFLIGAGCSTPALKALGNTEQKIQDYRNKWHSFTRLSILLFVSKNHFVIKEKNF